MNDPTRDLVVRLRGALPARPDVEHTVNERLMAEAAAALEHIRQTNGK